MSEAGVKPNLDTVEGRILFVVRRLRNQGHSFAEAHANLADLISRCNLTIPEDTLQLILKQAYEGNGQPKVKHSPSTVGQDQQNKPNEDSGLSKPRRRTKDRKTVGRLMTLRQAAEYAGLSYWLLRDYCLDGILPIVRLPGSRLKGKHGISCHSTEHTMRKIMIDCGDLDRLIQESKE